MANIAQDKVASGAPNKGNLSTKATFILLCWYHL